MPKYWLKVVNKTGDATTAFNSFCLFHELPSDLADGFASVAWMAQQCPVDVSVNFQWDTNYFFEWGFVSKWKTDSVFLTSQSVAFCPSDLTKNSIELQPIGASYHFCSYSVSSQEPGGLIHCAEGIAPGVAIGIGMSCGQSGRSRPVIATQAISHTSPFFPLDKPPKYRLAFGNYTAGALLGQSAAVDSFEVCLEQGYSQEITLDASRHWSAEPLDKPKKN